MIKNWFLIFVLTILQAGFSLSNVFASSTTFDGADTRVSITSIAAIEGKVVTFGCWTYRTGNGESNVGRIMSKVSDWQLRYDTGNYLLEAAMFTTAGNWTVTAPSTNAWTHVVVVYDGNSASNDPVIYFNGASQSVTESQPPVTAVGVATNSLTWGASSTAGAGVWAGRLADCFWYNRLLSNNEVKQIMHFGPKSLTNGLIGYWPLGNFAGLNLTTNSLAGTETLGTGSHNGDGPPINYPQGGKWGD